METETRHEPENDRFVVSLDGAVATLEYSRTGEKTLDYTSTFVPEEHRNRGIGERMVLDALDYAREQGFRVVPTCPFVRTVVKRHPEYQDILRTE